ncbi:precorrin-3B synthase [Methyloceanibacter stevinii]|nr:precorrin-3B synthase [Methyloceanibacter stevinii]
MSDVQRHIDDRETRWPRGACPRLSEPMETGDGLLARIVLSRPVLIDGFAALCAAARTHGNGLMEITARGSLQVRGLSDTSAPRFAAAVEALGIPFDDHVPVVGSPLPAHPRAGFNAQDLASEIRDGIAERPLKLAPKVSVVIDDGGPISLDGLAADVRLTLLNSSSSAPKVLVGLGGDGETATPLGVTRPEHAATVAVNLLAALAASSANARARDVIAREGLERFLRAAGDHLDTPPKRPAARTTETIGLHRLAGGACAIGVALPFGQAQALDLIALVRIAGANGADWVALAPQRTLLLGPIGEMTAFALGTAADTLGFIVDARDPRRRIAACAARRPAGRGISHHANSRRASPNVCRKALSRFTFPVAARAAPVQDRPP